MATMYWLAPAKGRMDRTPSPRRPRLGGGSSRQAGRSSPRRLRLVPATRAARGSRYQPTCRIAVARTPPARAVPRRAVAAGLDIREQDAVCDRSATTGGPCAWLGEARDRPTMPTSPRAGAAWRCSALNRVRAQGAPRRSPPRHTRRGAAPSPGRTLPDPGSQSGRPMAKRLAGYRDGVGAQVGLGLWTRCSRGASGAPTKVRRGLRHTTAALRQQRRDRERLRSRVPLHGYVGRRDS